jgi:integrase
MNRQKRAIKAKLNDAKGDLSKQWFVYYSCMDPATGRMVRFRDYSGFNKLRTRAARISLSNKKIQEINSSLEKGWTPFQDSGIIYENEVLYNKVSKKAGKQKNGTRDFTYYSSLFLKRIKSDVRPSSYTTYKSKLRIFNDWVQKKTKATIWDFNERTAVAFIQYLKDDRKVKSGINYYIELMRRLFDLMIEEKAIRTNPFKGVKKEKKNHRPPQYYGMEAVKLFKTESLRKDPQMWLVFRLIFYCFIRPKELRYLRIEHFHFDEGFIFIPAEISKTKRNRYPAIPQVFLKELISEGYAKYPKHFFVLSIKKKPAEMPKPISKNYLWNHFSAMRQSLNLPKDYKFYALKHTGMAMAKLAGVDTKDIQMQAGHHSLDMVDKYLNQLTPVNSNALRYEGPQI